MPRLAAEVRRATVDDLDDILDLWAQAKAELALTGRHMSPAEQVRPRLAAALADGSAEVVLARWDGRPAGFVLMRIAPLTLLVDAPAVHLEQLYVAPALRRHGIARALLGGVVARADRTGADQIVSSVMPWARETHRFFARLGFTPLFVRRGVATSALRRRLTGESPRGALEDLLLRRRSLRARSRPLPGLDGAVLEGAVLEGGGLVGAADDDARVTGPDAALAERLEAAANAQAVGETVDVRLAERVPADGAAGERTVGERRLGKRARREVGPGPDDGAPGEIGLGEIEPGEIGPGEIRPAERAADGGLVATPAEVANS